MPENPDRHVLPPERACGNLEDLPKLITFQKPEKFTCLPKNKCLRQPGRPHQAYNMSENRRNGRLYRRKNACGSREDLTKLTRYRDIQGPSFWLKSKSACGSREGLTLDSFQPAQLLIWHFYIRQRHCLKVPTQIKTPNIKKRLYHGFQKTQVSGIGPFANYRAL